MFANIYSHVLCHLIADTTENGAESAKKKVFIPHNREDLMNKFESLKVADDDDDGDFSFDDSDLDSDFDGGEFGDDDDEDAGDEK